MEKSLVLCVFAIFLAQSWSVDLTSEVSSKPFARNPGLDPRETRLLVEPALNFFACAYAEVQTKNEAIANLMLLES